MPAGLSSFLLLLDLIVATQCVTGAERGTTRFMIEAARLECLSFCQEKFDGSHNSSGPTCSKSKICIMEQCLQCQSVCRQKFSIQDIFAGQCKRYCNERLADVICSSSCGFLHQFYTQNAARNSFGVPSNLTLTKQQVHSKQLYLLMTWTPHFQTCHYYIVALPESATAILIERRLVGAYNEYSLGSVEPSTTYSIRLAACTENYVCSELSVSLTVSTLPCFQVYGNSLDHCVPPAPVNVSAQVEWRNNTCGMLLSWQSAIPALVESKQLHYVVSWFARSLDPDGTAADFHSITLYSNTTEYFIEASAFNVWYSIRVQSSSPKGSSASTSLTVFQTDCLDLENHTFIIIIEETTNTTGSRVVIIIISTSVAVLSAGIILMFICLPRQHVLCCQLKQQTSLKTIKVETGSQQFQLLADGRYPAPRDSANTQSPALPAAVSYEVAFQSISLHEELGRGAFGCVVRGHLSVVPLWLRGCRSPPLNVAVKMCKDNASRESYESLLKEIAMMLIIGRHEHIVSIVACCTTGQRVCLVMDYCSGGDLLTHLRKLRTAPTSIPGLPMTYISTPDKHADADTSGDSGVPESLVTKVSSVVEEESLLTGHDNLPYCKILLYAKQIAIGMEFLAQKKLVHRDLAARNVLIASADCLKISDFGLSRDVYHNNFYCKTTSGKLPLRWMSVEAIFDQIYTTKSDVWAFGILLWEIVTLGACPYPGINMRELPQLLKEGVRMQQPTHCETTLYSIMLRCWQDNPSKRPTFGQLRAEFDGALDKLTRTETSYLTMDSEM